MTAASHRLSHTLPLMLGAAALLAMTSGVAIAQQRPAAPAAAPGGATSTPLGALGANSKDPIKIDADRLDVRDKENMAIFSGNVVAVQGKTTIRCTRMIILYEGRQQPGQPNGQPAAAAPAPRPQPAASAPGEGGIKRLDCEGPVTVTSEDQVATGNKAVFDREKDMVIMTGNVALAKGPNITRGERLVYNTRTGIANIESAGAGGRVQGFFVPGSTDQPAAAAPAQPPAPRR